MTQLTKIENNIVEALIINGDLSKLKQEDKITYYKKFCERLGLDPFTQPFKILKLNGKEVLYCDRSGTQQLNKLHNVSHAITNRELIKEADVYQVTARAVLPDGRYTDSIGAVNIANLKGDNYANAIMKAETKAKRRATLDLLGLGLLDETETSTIPNAMTQEVFKGEPEVIEPIMISDSQISYIDNLIHNCTLPQEMIQQIENEMYEFTTERAEKCILYLKENQRKSMDEELTETLRKNG
jgi:hypothetical protein